MDPPPRSLGEGRPTTITGGSPWTLATEFGIIAAAVALAVTTLGGRAAAQQEPIPDTDLGRAAQDCIDAVDPAEQVDAGNFDFYDDGLSVVVHYTPRARSTSLHAGGLRPA